MRYFLIATAILASSHAFGITPAEHIETLRNMSFAPGGPWDEGEAQVKQRRCAPDGSYQDGKFRSFITYPEGEPSVSMDSKGTFFVTYSYSCRIRTRIVSGCGGERLNQDDQTERSTVTLPLKLAFNSVTYELTADPKPAEANLGGHERCGLGLVNALSEKLKDKVVSKL